MKEFKVMYKEVEGTQIFETMSWGKNELEIRQHCEIDLAGYEIVSIEEE